MYHILDKYASLLVLGQHPIAAPYGDSGDAEARAWIRLLEKATWRKYVRPILTTVPDPAGRAPLTTTEWAYEKLDSGEPTPTLLRAYRNTSHGYNIRKVGAILRDTGKIANDLPDIVLGLWHYLLRGNVVTRLRSKKVSMEN